MADNGNVTLLYPSDIFIARIILYASNGPEFLLLRTSIGEWTYPRTLICGKETSFEAAVNVAIKRAKRDTGLKELLARRDMKYTVQEQ